MTVYSHNCMLAINGRFRNVPIYYTIPYMPVQGEPRIWDKEDKQHKKYIDNCISIYSTKYRGTKAYYYLFKDLDSSFSEYLRRIDVSCIVPIASTHQMVYRLAEKFSESLQVPIVDMLSKIEESVFELKEGAEPPLGNILLVDDVTTSGNAIRAAISCILDSFNYVELDEIFVFCIGKTERNFYEWDDEKTIAFG